jgi:HEPN domain-containing protein
VTTLDDLLSRGLLQQVQVDLAAIDRLMTDARHHLRTAALALEQGDRSGAYQIAYDAARKALTAMLLLRGLRARGVGAHVTLLVAARSAFADAEGIDALERFDRVRRTRNRAEYFGRDFDEDEVAHDVDIASSIVALAERVLADGQS